MLRVQHHKLTSEIAPLDKQVVDDDQPIPSGHRVLLMSGRRGSGKTSIWLNLLMRPHSPWYKTFDNIILCSPTSFSDPKTVPLVTELEKDGNYYKEINEAIMLQIMDKLQAYNDQWKKDDAEWRHNEKLHENPFYTRIERVRGKLNTTKFFERRAEPKHLLILDDVLMMLPKSMEKSKINSIFCNGRHFKCSTVVTTQKYNSINKLIRANADCLFLWRTENRGELSSIEDDLTIDKDLFHTLYDFATEEPNSFLLINLAGTRPKFYRKFDRIRISD